MSDAVTVNQLQELSKEAFEKKEAWENQKELTSEAYQLYKEAEQNLVQTLQALELDKFISDYGTVSVKVDEDYKVPDDKEGLRAYLESRGLFNTVWTIHQKKFDSWMKEEQKIAKAEGKFFSVPGVALPTPRYSLRLKNNT